MTEKNLIKIYVNATSAKRVDIIIRHESTLCLKMIGSTGMKYMIEYTAVTSIDPKKAPPEQLREYLGEVLPNFDRERVYVADIKKLISWYNILISNGITEFKSEPEAEEEVATDEK